MVSSTVDAVFAAPRDVVYRLFAERESINPYLPVNFTLTKPGQADGVGAQYKIGVAGIGLITEETTKLVPGERVEYKIIKGAPVKRHVGVITFSDTDTGTLVSYTMESEPKVPLPAKVLEFGLRALISQFIGGAQKAIRA